MKAYLLFPDQDFQLNQGIPDNSNDLIQDLELNTLFSAMAQDDKFLFEICKKVILCSMDNDVSSVKYRQEILMDCIENESVVRSIYDIAVETIEREKKIYWGIFSRYPQAILGRSIDVLVMFVSMLKKFRKIAEQNATKFKSRGLLRLFAMLSKELDDAYFSEIDSHLKELKFKNGILISAQLGRGFKGENYVLRKPNDPPENLISRLFALRPSGYSFTISDRDEHGAKALSEQKDRGINPVANALAQSTEHILSFFTLLRTELAFYIGCLNLHQKLIGLGEPVCFPEPTGPDRRDHEFREMFDVSLALTMNSKIVGNNFAGRNKNLIIITGANQGGKTIFLRSIGLAQLMMQSGMFVPAASFRANLCDQIFTHFKREEDETMESGKLDEELSRMSEVIDRITPNSLLLLNESFSATNEREGSEIARQVIRALNEENIKIFYVTHLYEFARHIYESRTDQMEFLRAERQPDGTRTFKLQVGAPLQTSYGKDLYQMVFQPGSTGAESEMSVD